VPKTSVSRKSAMHLDKGSSVQVLIIDSQTAELKTVRRETTTAKPIALAISDALQTSERSDSKLRP
jgi:hypothetical protein